MQVLADERTQRFARNIVRVDRAVFSHETQHHSAVLDAHVQLAMSVVPKTRVAGVGQLLDEYVFKIFPFIRNSSFSYVEDLRSVSR